jgi:hypothetical protein
VILTWKDVQKGRKCVETKGLTFFLFFDKPFFSIEVYNLVHTLEDDKWMTTNQTYYGKYIMMPFGLTNAIIIF